MVELCPVCKGRGKIEQQSDVLPDVVIPSTTSPSRLFVPCHGCNSRGWVNPDGVGHYPDCYPRYPVYPHQTSNPIEPTVC